MAPPGDRRIHVLLLGLAPCLKSLRTAWTWARGTTATPLLVAEHDVARFDHHAADADRQADLAGTILLRRIRRQPARVERQPHLLQPVDVAHDAVGDAARRCRRSWPCRPGCRRPPLTLPRSSRSRRSSRRPACAKLDRRIGCEVVAGHGPAPSGREPHEGGRASAAAGSCGRCAPRRPMASTTKPTGTPWNFSEDARRRAGEFRRTVRAVDGSHACYLLAESKEGRDRRRSPWWFQDRTHAPPQGRGRCGMPVADAGTAIAGRRAS